MEENRLLTDIVAEYCVNFKYEDVPADVKQHIINILFDTVGLMLGGRDLDKGRIGIEFALEMGGGSDDCTLVGTNHRVSAMAAAFGNGELSHTLDGDILLPPAHLSTYIFAAILAEAERLHCTGKQLITAIALGSDIATRVGMSQGSFRIEATEETKNLSRADQMKPIKTYGMGCLSFGAAAAVAWLNGCDKEQMKDALGNTGYFIPNGSHQRFLFGPRPGMQKYSPAGWGNLVGYAGARLAALGCFGDREIFDGDHGWWAMQGTPQKLTEWLTKDLGNYWIVRDVRYKYFPTDGIYQAPCYLVWQLVEENNIKPEDIEHIPNIVIRKTKPLEHYGRLRKAYLEMHRPILFNELALSDKLFEHCAEIDEAARSRMERIVRSLAEQNGVTEQLKAENQMEWVRQMNACKAQAEEVVKAELIYD